jgi:hypothetical protein
VEKGLIDGHRCCRARSASRRLAWKTTGAVSSTTACGPLGQRAPSSRLSISSAARSARLNGVMPTPDARLTPRELRRSIRSSQHDPTRVDVRQDFAQELDLLAGNLRTVHPDPAHVAPGRARS